MSADSIVDSTGTRWPILGTRESESHTSEIVADFADICDAVDFWRAKGRGHIVEKGGTLGFVVCKVSITLKAA